MISYMYENECMHVCMYICTHTHTHTHTHTRTHTHTHTMAHKHALQQTVHEHQKEDGIQGPRVRALLRESFTRNFS